MTGSSVAEMVALCLTCVAVLWAVHISGTASDRDIDAWGYFVVVVMASWLVFIVWRVIE